MSTTDARAMTARERDDEEARHVADIVRNRGALAGDLDNARLALAAAGRKLEILSGEHVYDIEYAEGTEGPDIAAHLTNAARSVRAAQALARQADR